MASTIDYAAYIEKFTLSQSLADKISASLPSFGIEFDGAFASAVSVIMSNTLIIYLVYLATEVMIFIPKICIKLMHMPFGKGD